MKSIRILYSVLLLIGSLAYMQQANALPPGSYQQSCQSCMTIMNKLICTCKDQNQFPNITSLMNYGQCRGIQNINGNLVCRYGRRGGRRRWGLPYGSYNQTCRSCRIDRGQLSCQCLDRYQSWRWSNLPAARRCSYDIQNIDGQLRCTRRIGRRRPILALPRGSYKQTCNRCSYNGQRLSCMCQRRDQSWQSTELAYAYSCRRIKNINGRLVCRG